MSATRAAPSASGIKPVRATRSRRAAPDTDALVSEFDRVLKVGQPRAAPPKPASKPTTSKLTASKPKPTESKPKQTESKPRTVTKPAATRPARSTAAPAPKGKAKATEQYPWRGASMSSRDRALGAQKALNDTGRLMQEAHRDPTARPAAERAFHAGVAALQVLRELFANSGSAIGIEKTAVNLAIQCMALDMYKEALGVLVDSKKWIVKLYPHDPLPEPKPKAKAPTSGGVTHIAFPSPNGDVDEGLRAVICTVGLASWTCLVALGKIDPDVVQSCIPLPSSPSDLHPINIAPTIPTGNTTTVAVLAYRRLSTLPVTVGSPQWLHVRELLAFLLALCVGKIHAKPNVPDKVWESVARTSQVYLRDRKDDAAQRDIADLINRTVDVVETVCKSRGEERSQWFTAAWTEVAEVWIGIGRTLGDSAITESALGAMTASMTIGSKRSPSPESPPCPVVTSKSSSSAATAVPDLAMFSAMLAKTLIEVTALAQLDRPKCDDLERLLSASRPTEIVEPVCCLDDAERSLIAATNAFRSVERVRRVVIKMLDNLALASPARQWLEESFETFENVINNPKLPAAILTAAKSYLTCVLDTASNLLRVCDIAANKQFAIDLIDRGYSVWRSSSDISPALWVQNGAYIVQMAHSAAYRLSRVSAMAEACQLAQRACDWTSAIRDKATADETVASLQPWQITEAALPKRFEMLGFTSPDNKDKLEAYVLGLVNLPAAAIEKVENAAGSESLAVLLSGIPDAMMLLQRISTVVTSDKGDDVDVAETVKAALLTKEHTTAFNGAIVEQIIDNIEHGQFRPHVQVAIVALGDLLLETYGQQYPIRRMRVLVRLMSLVVSTGAITERFEGLADEVRTLANSPTGEDQHLVPFKFEYQSSALILSCLNQYYAEAEPSQSVATLGSEAIEVIRAVVVPPINETQFPAATGRRSVASAQRKPAPKATTTRAAPARTTRPATRTAAKAPSTRTVGTKKAPPKSEVKPAEPVTFSGDDIHRFSQLIGSLASLLGLLGHVLPRLETLKVLRAVLRSSDSMSDALVHNSGLLAVEYGRLGKYSRANQVFAQALKQVTDAKSPVAAGTRTDLHLRYARFLASTGHLSRAREEYGHAQQLMREIEAGKAATYAGRYVELCVASERIALAHGALASIRMAEMDVTSAIESLNIAYRLWSRAASGVSRISASAAGEVSLATSTTSEATTTPTESTKSTKSTKQPFSLSGKHLGGVQWYYAVGVLDATLELVSALAQRGTVKECEYYISQAKNMVPAVRSTALDARVAVQNAALDARKSQFETSAASLRHAAEVLAVSDGPDAVELKRLRGELYSRQQAAPEADEFFINAIEDIVTLDEEFTTSETHTSSPAKKGSKSPTREPLLPHALGNILRQRAWLLRDAGAVEEYQNVMQQLELVPEAAGEKPEQLFLGARVAMSEAFNHFKTDLFMSSLTESTIAMTMATPDKRKDRHSTRHAANVLLERAVQAFRNTLAADGRTGRVEDIRQACVSLAVLGAFQTSLGQGSPSITSMAAGILASISSLTLDRELLPAINSKFRDAAADDLAWPGLESPEIVVSVDPNSAYWKDVAARHNVTNILETQYDLSPLPHTWAVVSVTVTDDRNTMLVSRHQKGFDPVVFCIPLDRQGRREGEEESELFTFDAGINEMKSILEGNDKSIKSIVDCVSMDDRRAWWKERYALDTRLGELLATIEFCWLGAFKTVLNPRPIINAAAFTAFRDRLDHIFQNALSGAGTDIRRGARVRLNDTLLTCFATLSSKCKDEEIEDLVYFVLDQYQFHGIAVALAELDFEQIGVDVKAALADLEASTPSTNMESKEHLLLALDKNVQGIPWESLPILRNRAVSRIPSLPFLLDQVALGKHLGTPTKRTINSSKTTFFMNPGGDLVGTQERLKGRLDALEGNGWTGLRGRAPTEAEMEAALRDSELVMYFGHGGGEEYIRGYKVRSLPRCAVTMLWGCSSGLLRDHGNFDRTGTPYDYVLAGCPSLVANLWDVTDKDIDRVTEEVMDNLGLGTGGSSMSVVQAVSAARDTAKLKYLTGAATVVYGIPVYFE